MIITSLGFALVGGPVYRFYRVFLLVVFVVVNKQMANIYDGLDRQPRTLLFF